MGEKHRALVFASKRVEISPEFESSAGARDSLQNQALLTSKKWAVDTKIGAEADEVAPLIDTIDDLIFGFPIQDFNDDIARWSCTRILRKYGFL